MPTKAKKQSTTKKVAVKKPATKKKIHHRSPMLPLLITVTTLFVFTTGLASGVKMMKKKPVESGSMLFLQQSVTGSLRPNGSGTFLLTMVGVKPHTLLFADKNRMVGSWTNTDFVTRWNQTEASTGFATAHAVLMSHSQVDGKEYAVPVEISDAAFDGPGGWLSYTVKILQKTDRGDLTISSDRHMEQFPEILRSPALFIDGKSL